MTDNEEGFQNKTSVHGDQVHGDKFAGDNVQGNKVQIGSVTNTGSGPVNVAGGNIFQRITNIFASDTEAQRTLRDRQNMLQLVWNTWIEGVLKKSLHNEVLIELGMETRPDALDHPWEMQVQMPDQEPQMVPPGAKILDLFDQSCGSLLILGEPGSGKTTMLLELARQAIQRAQDEPDAGHPIPIVFNLSSWKPQAKQRRGLLSLLQRAQDKNAEQTFADWLVSELKDKYYVPLATSQPWIQKHEILLLLDGLDEVKAEYRDACVQAINAFQAQHGAFVAICCRQAEYNALITHLKLRSAVRIQALNDNQVQDYLQRAGSGMSAVLDALGRDAELREFANTPLILSILVLTYRNASNVDVRALEYATDRRQRLFDAYIAQMFKRRSADQPYPEQQTRHWLSWLARGMKERSRSIFYVEDIQPSWLPYSEKKRRLIFRLIGGLLFGMLFGLIGGLGLELIGGQIGKQIVWLIFELIGGPIGEVIGRAINWARVGLSFGLIGGLGFGLIGGLIVGLSVGNQDKGPTERLSWPLGRVRGVLIGGLIFGLIFGLSVGLLGGLLGGLNSGLGFGLIFGLSAGLSAGLFVGLSSAVTEDRTLPGDGIKASLRNFLFVWLIFGLIFVLSFGLVSGLVLRLKYGLSFGLSVGLSVGLIGGLIGGLIPGLRYGGNFLYTHFLTRILLSRSNHLPWNLIPFLDYCADRIFLRRVGGGYVFIHRVLMEHFAEMEDE